MSEKLSIHHVGGRNGSRSFPHVPAFETDIVNVLYDADPGSIDQAREQNAGLSSELHVLPYCLAEAPGKVAFYLNRDPFTSSNLQVNPACLPFYLFANGSFTKDDHDYVFGEAAAPAETRQIDAVSLDSLYRGKTMAAPPPDFLSIDTQGSEAAILRGAKETLKGVLAVSAEAEFHALYKDQPLFGELSGLLAEKGFHFVGFSTMLTMSPHRSPVGLRGGGFLVAGDAVFLRSADDLERSGLEPAALRTTLRKLAFIAIVYSQIEYALDCLRRAETLPVPAPPTGRTYERFLSEFQACAARVPNDYPPTFAEKYTPADHVVRFDTAAGRAAREAGTLKGLLKSVPLLGPALGRIKKVLFPIQRLAGRWREWPPFKSYSEVERLMNRYGLREQAEIMRRMRVAQAPSSRRVL